MGVCNFPNDNYPLYSTLHTEKKKTIHRHKGSKDKNLTKPDLPTYSKRQYITTSYFFRYIEVKARAKKTCTCRKNVGRTGRISVCFMQNSLDMSYIARISTACWNAHVFHSVSRSVRPKITHFVLFLFRCL